MMPPSTAARPLLPTPRHVQHSIGGNLAVGVAVKLRDKGAPLPAAILAVSPFFDFELKNPTVDGNAETDKLLSRTLLEFFRDCWLGGTGVGYDDPGVNPLYADLAGLPPVSVYYGEHEMLAGHVEWVMAWFEGLDLHDVTLVGQDWGSFIGLRIAAEQGQRIARIVIANGFLPAAQVPTPSAFRVWRAYARYSPVLPAGRLVAVGKPPASNQLYAVSTSSCWAGYLCSGDRRKSSTRARTPAALAR
jgi:acetyl esterase/lipase